MNKKVLQTIGLIAVVVIGVIVFVNQRNDRQKNVVKIEAVLPLTGDIASYGKDSQDGIDLAVELVNKSQKQFKFVVNYSDSRGEPKTAATITERIFAIGSPVAIIGEITSSSTASMIPICDKNKTFLISPTASAPHLAGLSSWFFRVYPPDTEEGVFMAQVVAEQQKNATVCIIFVNNDFGTGLKNVFTEATQTLGLQVLQDFSYSQQNPDFRAILARVKTLNPDAIYMPGYYQDGATLLTQIKEQGISARLYGSTTHEDPKLIEIAGSAAEGFMYPISTGFDPNSNDTTVENFIKEFNSKHDKDPGLVAALGYDCAKLIIEGVLNNGASSEDIRTYILNTKDLPGAAGTMNFDAKGEVHKTIVLKGVKDGKFQDL